MEAPDDVRTDSPEIVEVIEETSRPYTVPYMTPEGIEGLRVTFSNGKSLTVLPFSLRASFKRKRLMDEASQQIDNLRVEQPDHEDLKDETILTYRLVFYPTLAACSTGEIPSVEWCLNTLSLDADEWYNAVVKLNPHLFDVNIQKKSQDEQTKAKKNGRRRH